MKNPFNLVIREFDRRPKNVAIFLNRAVEVDVIACKRCRKRRVGGGRWKGVDSVEAEVLSRRCRGGEKGRFGKERGSEWLLVSDPEMTKEERWCSESSPKRSQRRKRENGGQ